MIMATKWNGLTGLEQELIVQAEIYAQVRVEYADIERLDAAENLRGYGLLYTYDSNDRVKIFEITDGGREVYKQGNAIELAPADEPPAQAGEFVPGVFVIVNGVEIPLAEYDEKYGAAHGFKAVDNGGVDKTGILEKYLRDGKLISAIKAHRRFYGSDIDEAKKAIDQLSYDMKMREDSQPTYAELAAENATLRAQLAAVTDGLNHILSVWKLMIEMEVSGQAMSETTLIVRMVAIANKALQAASKQADREG